MLQKTVNHSVSVNWIHLVRQLAPHMRPRSMLDQATLFSRPQPPIIPVSRPSFCRVPPGKYRSIPSHTWQPGLWGRCGRDILKSGQCLRNVRNILTRLLWVDLQFCAWYSSNPVFYVFVKNTQFLILSFIHSERFSWAFQLTSRKHFPCSSKPDCLHPP